jgi:hypothetical protein
MQSDGEGWSISNDDQRRALLAYIEANKHKDICFKIVQPTRTTKQNRAIHAYCREVANQMAAMGLDMREVLKPTIEITPTMAIVKDHIWRRVQEAITGKVSTKDIGKKDVDTIYQTIARHLAEKHDISVPFGKK